MIVFDLECHGGGHRFEGWFKSSQDYADQLQRGLLRCPSCGSTDVFKAIQAPRLTRKGNQVPDAPAPARLPTPPVPAPATGPTGDAVAHGPLPPQAVELLKGLARMQAEALKTSTYVGETFVEDARAMHYGEREVAAIYGQATVEEAKELLEEGIAVMPLPFPVVPPEQAN